MTDKKRMKILQNLGILTLTLISLYYINVLFGSQIEIFKTAANSIVLPFGIALFLSYLLAPLVTLLEKRMKIKNKLLTVFIVFLVVILAIAGFSYFVGITLYEQAVSFFQNDWEGIVEWVNKTIAEYPALQDTYDSIASYISIDSASPYLFNVVNIVRSLASIIIIIVLIPVFLFFLLKEKNTVFNGIVSVIPKKYQHHVNELGTRANEVIQKYFNGRFLSMFIMSIIFTVMFLVFGFSFERSLFFGFTLGFLDIIPYIGGFIGIVLPVLYSFTVQGDLLLGEWTFIGLIVVNLVLQGFQGNILQPYIMGKEVNLHPLLVLTSFIFFGSLFGISGVILAIPITGIIKTSAQYFNELNTQKEEDQEKTNKVIIEPKPPVKSKPTPKKLTQKK